MRKNHLPHSHRERYFFGPVTVNRRKKNSVLINWRIYAPWVRDIESIKFIIILDLIIRNLAL